MNAQKTRIAGSYLFLVSFVLMALAFVVVTAFTSTTANAAQEIGKAEQLEGATVQLKTMAAQKASIPEGTYYIKAANGNAKGQVLYWNKDASDQNTSMMFESCGGAHADSEVWFITKNRNFDDYYGIYLNKTYTGNKDKCNRIEIDNLTGRDQPYLMTTKGPHVFCGSFGNQDDAFVFIRESGDNDLANLSIRSHDDNYRFNRHKEVKVFHHDLIYVNANKDNDTNNKLWELVPVNYAKKLGQAAPALVAQKNGNVKINWDKLRNKVKSSKVWKNAQYIEVQYSTDKQFLKNAKSKTIKKGTLDKTKAKSALNKLKGSKTYYVRARLIDEKGISSNWSKTATVSTKK